MLRTENELPYIVEAVSFNDGQIAVQYVDPTKDSKRVMVAETIMFEPKVLDPELLDALLRMICDVIDDAHTELRNPPARIR